MSVNPKEVICRGLISGLETRAIDEEAKTIEFVASTETGVDVFDWDRGLIKEYLRADGLNLERYNKNSTVLDTHDRSTIRSILADAKVWVEGNQVISRLRFHELTKEAKEAWDMARAGFIKAISVGFTRDKVKKLGENEFDGDGESRVDGPADIVTSWSLIELSLCPVGADPNALQRALDGHEVSDELRALVKHITQETINEANTTEDRTMADNEKTEIEKTVVKRAAPEKTKPPVNEEAARILVDKEIVRAFCPAGLEALADTCILEGKSVDETRAILLDAHAKRCTPVGTAAPANIKKSGGRTAMSNSKTNEAGEPIIERASEATREQFDAVIGLR